MHSRCILPLATFLLVSCASAAPTASTPVTPPPPPVATAASPPPLLPADAKPTELTAEQQARDAARAPVAGALIDAFVNGEPVLAHDRKRVLFQSNRAGSSQAYLGDVTKPDAPPVAITQGPERAEWPQLTRDGKAVVFLRDQGADENFRIFKVGLDGKGLVNLTPGRAWHRDPPLEPSKKPGTLIYTRHDPRSPASELIVQNLAGGDPKVVYTDPSPASLSDVTPDGRRALLVRTVSASEGVVLDLDLVTGDTRRVYPAPGRKAGVNDARYATDGQRVFVAADDGAEGQFVYGIDTVAGTIAQQWKQADPPTAFVESLEVSPQGGLIAIEVNAGNRSEVRILDAATLTLKTKVESPLGRALLGRFSDDGARFTLTVSTPASPSDVFTVDTATGATSPLRKDARPGVDALKPVTPTIESVRAFDGLTIPVNTYLPQGVAAGAKLPVIVSFHGGPASSSQVRWSPYVRFFTSLGYAFLEPNVRGSVGFGRAFEMADNREKRADWLKDLEAVNVWAKAQPWADPDHVVVFGGSYGGYTVLMALTRQPSLWRAGVDMFGPANIKTFLKSTDQSIRTIFVQEFGDLEKDSALLDEYSPVRDVGHIKAPLFIYQGANDPRVPQDESDQIVVALRSRGVPVEYMVAADEGHSLDRRENRVAFMTRVARFLEDNLK